MIYQSPQYNQSFSKHTHRKKVQLSPDLFLKPAKFLHERILQYIGILANDYYLRLFLSHSNEIRKMKIWLRCEAEEIQL